MASIPLPALDVRTPQPEDALGSFQKLMALRSLANQQQIQQQTIQTNQQEQQMRALQLQDQQTLRESAKGLDWTQPDTFDKWITNAQQKGVSPQTLSDLSLKRAQYQEQLAKTDTATLAAEKDRNSQLQGHIDAIKGIADPTKRAEAAQTQGTQILQSGLAKTPQAQQMAQSLASGRYVPSDDDLAMFENGLTDHNTQIDQRLKQAQTAKDTADALLNQNKLDIVKSWKENPQQVMAQVDSIIPPSGANAALNARTKSQVQFALGNGDVDGAKAAIKQAAEQVGAVEKDIAVNTNPQIQAGKEAVAAAEGSARAETEINTKRQETSDAQFQTAIGADERLNRMEKSYTDAVKNHNQQAMLALLTDHIGMTLGLQKGARITKDILNEAAQSQPWLAKMAAKFDDDGYLSGVNLSPGQMKQMLDLGYAARENAWGGANSTAQMYGVKPPPNAAAIYNKRDPNARVYDKTAAPPAGATHVGIGSADKKKHYLDKDGKDLGLAE